MKNVSISLVARNEDGLVVGCLFGLTDFCYWLYVTDLGVDRNYERQGIGRALMKKAHEIAGGEKDIAVYLVKSSLEDREQPDYELFEGGYLVVPFAEDELGAFREI